MTSLYTLLFFSFLYRFSILASVDALNSDHSLKSCHFDQIYQFGDSLSDVRNFIREPNRATTPFTELPFGQTFFKNATGRGRVSDGLLLIDYMAIEAGLPLLNPHLNYQANFLHGEDFAVAGATALSADVLAAHNISSSATSSSLSVQLDWMLAHFNSTCYSNRYCAKKLSNALFMVGEVGGNDYNNAVSEGRTLVEVERELVPAVVQVIKNTVRTLINNGAHRIVVPGQFPFGCFPIHLTLFKTNDSIVYDDLHCVKSVNNILMYHNEQLQLALQELKQEYPHAIIIYGDYYNAFMWLFRNARYFGFDSRLLQKSCCGIGGEYHYHPDVEMSCGLPGVPVCPDPRQYISWDGVHMTQEAHKMLSTWIIRDMLPQLRCSAKLDPITFRRKSLKTKFFSSMYNKDH